MSTLCESLLRPFIPFASFPHQAPYSCLHSDTNDITMAGGGSQRMLRATQRVNETAGGEEECTTMEGDTILEEIHKAHDESIPKATKAAYAGPIRDYRTFCLEWAVEKEGKCPLDCG